LGVSDPFWKQVYLHLIIINMSTYNLGIAKYIVPLHDDDFVKREVAVVVAMWVDSQ
jgi:hypothetical protein